LEPGRFRAARDRQEAGALAARELRDAIFPPSAERRVFLTHTRPEPLLAALRPLDSGGERTRVLGYLNRGGTLATFGIVLANRATGAHAVATAAELLGRPLVELLSPTEIAAVHGEGDPNVLRR